MRARSKVIVKANWLTLTRYKSLTTNRTNYVIKANMWKVPGFGPDRTELVKQIVEHFNPGKNRGTGLSWKFRNKLEAEQLISIAIMKWGA